MKKKIVLVLMAMAMLLSACGSKDSNVFDRVMGVTDFNKAIKILGEPDLKEEHSVYYNYMPFLGKIGKFGVRLRAGQLYDYYLDVDLPETSDEDAFSEYETQCVDYFTEKYGDVTEYWGPDKYLKNWTYTWNLSDESYFRVSCYPGSEKTSPSVTIYYTP